MKCKKSIRKALLVYVLLFLIQEIVTEECGWAHRIERFLAEPDAMEGSWPWMVQIFKLNSDGEEIHSCSGSMISSKHILSIAQCFDHKNYSQYKAKIGHVDERLAPEYNIIRIVLPDSYVLGQFHDDLAILTLARNVDTENFNPICLPPKQGFVNLTGQYAVVVGWGPLVSRGPTYPYLREKFGLLVIPNSRCQKFAENSSHYKEKFPRGIANEMICTASPNECIVAIDMRNRQGEFYPLCSGSMISMKHALVPAHCFPRRDPTLYKARIGNVDLRLAQEYNITRIVVHDEYVRNRFRNDIAILTLEKDLESGDFYPICLPPSREFVNLEGQNNAVVGWELLSLGYEHPELKEYFGIEVIANSRCNAMYSRMIAFRRQFPRGVGDGMICTASTQICLVESGSPLMYQVEGAWYIVGFVSFGTSCTVSSDFPSGFTKVSEYLNWIEENIKS
ncbi:venom serine protease Bi-VSP-like isoform X3 [Argiope bruennichi]|uniref:venom serine protease Bi-VSP-like isoform X3 n=1 Tax=Argiope bruennichi TaxID=94029 RepID=UPI0024943ACE|nr:venom serine protease Bi-VSP-like isoform X3 [Argiope bruennichi]